MIHQKNNARRHGQKRQETMEVSSKNKRKYDYYDGGISLIKKQVNGSIPTFVYLSHGHTTKSFA